MVDRDRETIAGNACRRARRGKHESATHKRHRTSDGRKSAAPARRGFAERRRRPHAQWKLTDRVRSGAGLARTTHIVTTFSTRSRPSRTRPTAVRKSPSAASPGTPASTAHSCSGTGTSLNRSTPPRPNHRRAAGTVATHPRRRGAIRSDIDGRRNGGVDRVAINNPAAASAPRTPPSSNGLIAAPGGPRATARSGSPAGRRRTTAPPRRPG